MQLRDAALIHSSVSTGEQDAGEGLNPFPQAERQTKSLSLEWEEEEV